MILKNVAGKIDRKCSGRGVAILNRVDREVIVEKVTFKPREVRE